jgi:hypothetical protein
MARINLGQQLVALPPVVLLVVKIVWRTWFSKGWIKAYTLRGAAPGCVIPSPNEVRFESEISAPLSPTVLGAQAFVGRIPLASLILATRGYVSRYIRRSLTARKSEPCRGRRCKATVASETIAHWMSQHESTATNLAQRSPTTSSLKAARLRARCSARANCSIGWRSSISKLRDALRRRVDSRTTFRS